MTRPFTLKALFNDESVNYLIENFGFKRSTSEELTTRLQQTFGDYIIAALTELADGEDDRHKLYVEACYHLDKARKLLEYSR